MQMILETISFLSECKDLVVELRVKDHLLREEKHGFLGALVEGEIAKMAVREFENSQNAIRFLQSENDNLKAKNA